MKHTNEAEIAYQLRRMLMRFASEEIMLEGMIDSCQSQDVLMLRLRQTLSMLISARSQAENTYRKLLKESVPAKSEFTGIPEDY